MATLRPVSPILDGYSLEKTISNCDGIQCCTAIEKNSAETYVVKMISVPASPVQMEAMLLTGAFSGRAEANIYFKEQARALLNEAKTLRHMAALGGFADFDSVQVVPAEQENGFEVYFLSPQRTSLQQILARPDVTQLEIVNMALDICAALATCRHAGFFYANLKPSNVFLVGQHYRIGDLGFLPLSAVGRSPLPDKLRNRFTPPELLEENSPLNSTADLYALGLMLYQAYNGGVLPGKEDVVGQLLAPPKYADYEMAEIILRACAPDPQIRWNDPEQMGHALARYLQRNGMHNIPIIPPATQKTDNTPFPQTEQFLPEIYTESDFQEDLWSTEAPVATSSFNISPPVRKRRTTSFNRRIGFIAIIVLAVILAIELAIGIYLLCRNARDHSEEMALSVSYYTQDSRNLFTSDHTIADTGSRSCR